MTDSKPNSHTAVPYSKTIAANNFLFLSGQVGIDEHSGKLVDAGIEAETTQVMRNIDTVLKKEGLKLSDLVSVNIYLKSMDHYQAVNKVYISFFTGKLPARVCLAVADLPMKANVEISAIAKIEASYI